MTLFQKRVSDSSFDRARTVTYIPPIPGKRCSNMLSVTLPRKPVPPIKKIFRPLKISVGESLAVMIQVCLPLPFGRGMGRGSSLLPHPLSFYSSHYVGNNENNTGVFFH